jgi:hypothetical protein
MGARQGHGAHLSQTFFWRAAKRPINPVTARHGGGQVIMPLHTYLIRGYLEATKCYHAGMEWSFLKTDVFWTGVSAVAACVAAIVAAVTLRAVNAQTKAAQDCRLDLLGPPKVFRHDEPGFGKIITVSFGGGDYEGWAMTGLRSLSWLKRIHVATSEQIKGSEVVTGLDKGVKRYRCPDENNLLFAFRDLRGHDTSGKVVLTVVSRITANLTADVVLDV